MRLLSRRAQSTGEYAILFAIVLGAVIAMQNYVRNRVAGALQGAADTYQTSTGGGAVAMTRESDSLSASSADMTTANQGTFRSDSDSVQIQTNPVGGP